MNIRIASIRHGDFLLLLSVHLGGARVFLTAYKVNKDFLFKNSKFAKEFFFPKDVSFFTLTLDFIVCELIVLPPTEGN